MAIFAQDFKSKSTHPPAILGEKECSMDFTGQPNFETLKLAGIDY
jgi:hypothetical protein